MRVCSFVRFLLSSIQLSQLTYQYPGTEFLKFFFYSFHIIYILFCTQTSSSSSSSSPFKSFYINKTTCLKWIWDEATERRNFLQQLQSQEQVHEHQGKTVRRQHGRTIRNTRNQITQTEDKRSDFLLTFG